ncbi:MFS transporter [Paenibacillus pinistramenti]|uniref:MFS transporter n=1 Tax=Paenibacillus pinistramenti TaxID=1768003 RepID=UPI0011095E29|nr:MFS transporter [Paenibacillus pinistramenti]
MNKPKKFWSYENSLLLMLSFGYGMIFMDRFSITYLFPNIASEFHLNNAQLGLTMSVVGFAWGVSAIIFSYISDIIKKKKFMLILFLMIFSLSTLFSGLATGFVGLILSRAILGIAEGPSAPLIQTSMMTESTPSRRGLNTGIIISCSSILGSLSPLLMVAIANSMGWRYAFYIITIPGIIVSLLLMKFMREPKTTAETEGPSKIRLSDVKIVLKSRNIWISIVAAIFNVGFMITGFSSFAPTFLMDVGHFSQSQSAQIMSVYGLVAFIWNISIPWLSDRIGRKPTVLIAGIMGILTPLSFIFFHSNYTMLIVCITLFGAGQALGSLLFFVIPGESVPIALMATATAIINFVGEVVGGTIGPALDGALADQYSLYWTMILTTGAAVIVFLVSLGYKETAPRQRQPVKNNQAALRNELIG